MAKVSKFNVMNDYRGNGHKGTCMTS